MFGFYNFQRQAEVLHPYRCFLVDYVLNRNGVVWYSFESPVSLIEPALHIPPQQKFILLASYRTQDYIHLLFSSSQLRFWLLSFLSAADRKSRSGQVCDPTCEVGMEGVAPLGRFVGGKHPTVDIFSNSNSEGFTTGTKMGYGWYGCENILPPAACRNSIHKYSYFIMAGVRLCKT